MARDAIQSDKELFNEVDGLYCQLVNILHRDERFEQALAKGELTDEACQAIAAAFDEVFERNRRLADIFLADKMARQEITRFWFARGYAEVQANAAFNRALKTALSAIPAA